MTDLVLQPGRDRSVRRRHPWLLSGSVERIDGDVSPGSEVRVVSSTGELLARGHVSPDSKLRVRIFSFGKDEPPADWLERRIAEAVARRADDPLL